MRAYLSLDGVLSYLEDAGTPLFNDIVLPSGIDKGILEECIYEDGAEFGVIYTDPPFFKSRVEGWFRRKYDTFQKWNDVLNSTYNPIENYDRIEDWTDTGTSSETGTRSDVGTSHTEGETHDNLQEQTTGTSSDSETQSGRTQTDNNSTDNLVKTNREVTDQDGTSATRASAHNTSETTVSAFNDGSYAPSQKVAVNSGEFVAAGQPDTTNTATTNDVTVTNNGTDTRTIQGQEIEQTSGTTTGSGTTSGTRAVIESGTSQSDGRTTLTSDTTGSRENEGVHSGRIHGNIGVTTTQHMIEEEIQLRHNFNIYSMISDCFCDEFLIKVY